MNPIILGYICALGFLVLAYISYKYNVSDHFVAVAAGFLLLFTLANLLDNSSTSNESRESVPAKPSYGNESCLNKVDANISGAGGWHTGIEYQGKGVFFALVANETTKYKYVPVFFYTDADCNIINAVWK